jgi:hypothetical protein
VRLPSSPDRSLGRWLSVGFDRSAAACVFGLEFERVLERPASLQERRTQAESDRAARLASACQVSRCSAETRSLTSSLFTLKSCPQRRPNRQACWRPAG